MGANSNFNYSEVIGTTSTNYDNPIVNTIGIKETVCPNCHYCPTCGRGSHYLPYVPYPYVSYNPYYTNEPISPQYQVWY